MQSNIKPQRVTSLITAVQTPHR